MSYIAKCDKCGATEDLTGHGAMAIPDKYGAMAIPDKWRQAGIQVTSRLTINYRFLHFCPRCSDTLCLSEEPTEETVADKLMSILEAIVEDAIDQKPSFLARED